MIVFDLRCGRAHVFEAWFGSSADYAAQRARGLVRCPVCDDAAVEKAAMAPAVAAKGNRQAPAHPASRDNAESKARLAALAAMQAKVEAECDYVGRDFAAKARAAHDGKARAARDGKARTARDGEATPRGMYGEATLGETRALLEDGVPIAPLPFRPKRLVDA